MPGTEINVTPEIAAPIIAIDTKAHGVLRLPVKKVELSDLRDAKNDIKNNRQK